MWESRYELPYYFTDFTSAAKIWTFDKMSQQCYLALRNKINFDTFAIYNGFLNPILNFYVSVLSQVLYIWNCYWWYMYIIKWKLMFGIKNKDSFSFKDNNIQNYLEQIIRKDIS